MERALRKFPETKKSSVKAHKRWKINKSCLVEKKIDISDTHCWSSRSPVFHRIATFTYFQRKHLRWRPLLNKAIKQIPFSQKSSGQVLLKLLPIDDFTGVSITTKFNKKCKTCLKKKSKVSYRFLSCILKYCCVNYPS